MDRPRNCGRRPDVSPSCSPRMPPEGPSEPVRSDAPSSDAMDLTVDAWAPAVPVDASASTGPSFSSAASTLEPAPTPAATGRGVRIAVIDSGVFAAHPHVGGIAGGVSIALDGTEDSDFVDRLGHGTAVTAAIKEKAADAEIY